MPNRFPFLKSKSDPYGLIEQFGIAVTVSPESDSADTGPESWFGRTLETTAFVFTYSDDNTGKPQDRLTGHGTITSAYAAGDLLYTAYDWAITSLNLNLAAKTGVVEGSVRLKGRCNLFKNNPPAHDGRHFFRYDIVQVGRDWLIKEWTLRKEKKPIVVPNLLDELINAPL